MKKLLSSFLYMSRLGHIVICIIFGLFMTFKGIIEMHFDKEILSIPDKVLEILLIFMFINIIMLLFKTIKGLIRY